MSKIICGTCNKVHETNEAHCPECGPGDDNVYDFSNSDEYLNGQVPRVLEERKNLGLEGLTGGLEYIVINTEPDILENAANELIARTGHDPSTAFEDKEQRVIILSNPGSSDILVKSRSSGENPFTQINNNPKSRHLPNTRLETLVFRVHDIDRYFKIQNERAVRFQTREVQKFENYSYIETLPSRYTGNALGFIEWTGERGDFMSNGRKEFKWKPAPQVDDIRVNVGVLDHMATRVRAADRDQAIVEFMELTDYTFAFAIYVKVFNSITNVARLAPDEYAMVFTSGIRPFVNEETSGPTEKFINNYGTRVHHMAFRTEMIEKTFEGFKKDGQKFLLDLVGSEEEGLKQTFTESSEHTMLVNEYIHRYGDFTGFFTKSNVTDLTGSTDQQ
jgi:4-hydroxyphenylpyruvate dioxygenase-like putative hemolysin